MAQWSDSLTEIDEGDGASDWPALCLEMLAGILSQHSHATTRPDYALANTIWVKEVSASIKEAYFYDGAQDILLYTIDVTNHLLNMPLGGGSDTIASATTTDIGSKAATYLAVSGTTTITGLGTSAKTGQSKFVTFSGALTLTHNASSLILPGGASITTAAGDKAIFVYLGSGNWQCLNYARASNAFFDVASATTTDLGAASSDNVRITGTTTITGFGTVAAGVKRTIRFAGALTLTHNGTSLILPGGTSITTAANDSCEAISLGSGNWYVTRYDYAGAITLPANSLGTTPAQGDSSSKLITSDFFSQNFAGGYVNKFRNGCFNVWQRGDSVSINTSGAHGPDGWFIIPAGASITAAPFSLDRMVITGAASVTGCTARQRVSYEMAGPMLANNVRVTIQFLVGNFTGNGSITPKLTVKYPTSTNDGFGSLTTDLNAVNLQPCADSSYTLVAYTYDANAGCGRGMEVTIDFNTNLNSGSKQVLLGRADLRNTPGVTTGLNSVPPPAELRGTGIELPLCQHYFETSYGNHVALGSASGLGCSQWAMPNTGASGKMRLGTRYKMDKRATPTVTLYDLAGTSGNIVIAGVGNVAGTVQDSGRSGFAAEPTSNQTGNGIQYHWASSAEL